VATAAGAGGALVFLVPLAAGEVIIQGPPELTSGAVLSVLYLGLLASAAAYGLWNYALERVDASVAAPFINLVPVIGLALAIASGESTTALQLAGGAVVGLGVWLSTTGAKRRTQTRDVGGPRTARGGTRRLEPSLD
jgi:drug/metabolite transporter (DMT)-like permease